MANYDSFLFDGHGVSEVTGATDPGAISRGVKEHDLVTVINNHAKQFLSKTKLNMHYDEQNFVDIDVRGNVYKAKAGLSVHINAGGGTGVEIYVPLGEKHLKLDFELVANLAKTMGIPNRGVKSREYYSGKTHNRSNNNTAMGGVDYYKEIREAWNGGNSLALLEVGFIDTSDLGKMQAHTKKIGWYIADYICKLNGIATPAFEEVKVAAPAVKPGTVVEYKVQIVNDAIYVLNAPNVNANIVQTIKKDQVFTIVEENNGYGKLKSGAGWINLKYTKKLTTAPKEFKVKIKNAAIYVLSTSNSSGNIVQTIKKDEVYTIVEEKNGYGKLKSGAGWINLSYTIRL